MMELDGNDTALVLLAIKQRGRQQSRRLSKPRLTENRANGHCLVVELLRQRPLLCEVYRTQSDGGQDSNVRVLRTSSSYITVI